MKNINLRTLLIYGLCLLSLFNSGCAFSKPDNAVSVQWIDSSKDEWPPSAGSDFIYEGVRYNYYGRTGLEWLVDYSKMDLLGQLLTGGTGKALKPEKILGIPVISSYNDVYGLFLEKDTPSIISNCSNIWIDESLSLQPPELQRYEMCEIGFIDADDKGSRIQPVLKESFLLENLISEDAAEKSVIAKNHSRCCYLKLYVEELVCLYVSMSVYCVNGEYYLNDRVDYLQETGMLHLLRLNDDLQNTLELALESRSR